MFKTIASQLVDEEIYQQRMKLCRNCEHWAGGVCKKCGCICKIKTKWKKSSCPVGKWNKKE